MLGGRIIRLFKPRDNKPLKPATGCHLSHVSFANASIRFRCGPEPLGPRARLWQIIKLQLRRTATAVENRLHNFRRAQRRRRADRLQDELPPVATYSLHGICTVAVCGGQTVTRRLNPRPLTRCPQPANPSKRLRSLQRSGADDNYADADRTHGDSREPPDQTSFRKELLHEDVGRNQCHPEEVHHAGRVEKQHQGPAAPNAV